MIFILSAIIGPTWIASQTITPSSSRKISYDQLNEFAKLIEYSDKLDSIAAWQKQYIIAADSVAVIRQAKLDQYEGTIVPNLEAKVELQQTIINGNQDQYKADIDLQKYKTKKARRNGWLKFGAGALVGILLGIFASG